MNAQQKYLQKQGWTMLHQLCAVTQNTSTAESPTVSCQAMATTKQNEKVKNAK